MLTFRECPKQSPQLSVVKAFQTRIIRSRGEQERDFSCSVTIGRLLLTIFWIKGMCFESQWFGCGAATSRIFPPTVARFLEEIRMIQGQANNRRAASTPRQPDGGDVDPSYTL